ncbi:serine/threonine protein kinase [Nitzschia inconspicua]|uniref:Serine/threonine protein kinase n=1 Tax=Nitzschia inconspicua TaxID=303405 RepID=A0A9K3Q4L1_9STRA|nr:serine/threonine protein kinase [Nitzschia inconspicua]
MNSQNNGTIGNCAKRHNHHHTLSSEDKADVFLSHQYRLGLTSSPSQSSFRVLALLFYEEIDSDKDITSSSKPLAHLPPWIKKEVPSVRYENGSNGRNSRKRTFIVGTNDEPGYIGGAICAERSAMVQLRFLPSFRITKLVIATDSVQPIACGMLCREFLAGHTSVPWDLEVISTACQCSRCGLRDEELFLQKTACTDEHDEHSIPTLCTTIAELYPYPSPYTRLTAAQSLALGERYNESIKSSDDLTGLQETTKRLLELAIIEAKANISEIHPIQFGAAAMLEDESIVTSHQSSALEYGCTLDAVSQLVPHFKDEDLRPIMLVQADQFGIAHAPFAPARSFLSEHGFQDCMILLHETPSLENVADNFDRWKLKEVCVSDLAPNAPDWKTTTDKDDDDGPRCERPEHENHRRRRPPSRERSQDKDQSMLGPPEGYASKPTPKMSSRKRPSSPNSSSELDDSSLHKEKLKIVSQDLVNKFNESKGSFSSELSQSVNDSALGLSFDDVYDKQEMLGEGGFAFVYRCFHKERGKAYAVKEIFSENYETSGQSMSHEIFSLKRLKDIPYIVRLLDVFKEPDTTRLIMEEMTGGDLLDRLYEKEVFTEEESRKISRRLLEALFFCHKKGIAHRDVKPENILLVDKSDDTKIKLADFGCSHPIDARNCLHTMCGSPQYAAPEIYQHVYGYDERCDLWSAGVVIFVILGGYAPFEGDPAELPSIICEGHFKFDYPEWKDISFPPMHLIKRLLVVDPDDRATVEEALDSQWLKRRDKDRLKQHAANLDGTSTGAFHAWVKLNNSSNHTISSYAVDVLFSDGSDGIKGEEVEEEFCGDDSMNMEELKP